MQRVVLDTNAWVSAILNPGGVLRPVRDGLVGGRFTLLISEPLLDEVADVLGRPRIAAKYGVTVDARDELMALLRHYGVMTPVTGAVRVCRDPDDDAVIETAATGQATLLVTRDEDIYRAPEVLAVLNQHGIAVVGLRRFLATIAD
jgi:putative PIN family toxin of toxin-antitoxin system